MNAFSLCRRWAVPAIFCFASAAARAETVNLTVNTDKVVQQVDVKIYGQFLEHIYHSLHGGLWGEIVWNRSFEEGLPRPGRGRGAAQQPPPTPPPGGTIFRHWQQLGNAVISTGTESAFNSRQDAKILAEAAGDGIAQGNFCLRPGDICRGSLWLRGDAPDGLTVRFLDGDKVLAEQTLPAPSATWKEYPLALNPSAATKSAVLQIAARGKADFSLDQVSLMPDSYRADGGFRTDLLQAVMGLQPASLRWPGGSYVGTNGGYDWKGGIGPQAGRVGKVGWDEFDPSAFGVDEFIALCRKVNAEPIIVVYLGSRMAGADHAKQIQEACDFVEYCNGPATSLWGGVRAANGHPEPYQVKYWEIDNEIWSMQPDDYVRVVREFMAAMKRVDPSIIGIACGSGGIGAPTSRFSAGDIAVIEQASDVVDYLSIHHYENENRYAEGVAAMEAYVKQLGELIAKSKNPNFKLYVSEWNFRRTIDWRTGLYAGGILNYFEREKYTPMSCPALFLRHASAPDWDNAFINFDNASWFPAPNYVVMKLWRDHYAPNLLQVAGVAGGLNATATKSADGRRVILKLVNPTDQPLDIKLGLEGNFSPAKATLQLIAPDDLMARNSMEQPGHVRVTDGQIERTANKAAFSLPRWSVAVVELSN